MKDYCEELMSNETSCTTASSEGEDVVKQVVAKEAVTRREINLEDEVYDMQLDRYNPLIHKTSF